MKGFWQIPYRKQLDASKTNHDVCVVGIFGKSSWTDSSRSFVIKNLIKSYDQPLEPNRKQFPGGGEDNENSLFEFMFVYFYPFSL